MPSDQESSGILFFDELNAAPPLVQASLYQLTLDRRIGEYILPAGWRIIAAGNRAEDGAVVFRMPSALANRFVHLDFEVDFEDWSNWAITSSINPLIQAFLRLRRELLLDTSVMDRGFPTPRAWEMASDALLSFGEPPPETLDVLIGIVGEGAAMEFVKFAERSLNAERAHKILEDPENAELPKELGDLYALVSFISSASKNDYVVNAAGRLLNRLTPEIGVMLTRQILRLRPDFASDKGFVSFIRKHQVLLA